FLSLQDERERVPDLPVWLVPQLHLREREGMLVVELPQARGALRVNNAVVEEEEVVLLVVAQMEALLLIYLLEYSLLDEEPPRHDDADLRAELCLQSHHLALGVPQGNRVVDV